jgi:CheY-like chemotaxis protein
VDDNQEIRESVVLLLTLLGHSATAVQSGSEALERIQTEQPDVMLVDLGMPQMDGFELARRVRAQPALERIRLFALSGYGSADDQRRAREAGSICTWSNPWTVLRCKCA